MPPRYIVIVKSTNKNYLSFIKNSITNSRGRCGDAVSRIKSEISIKKTAGSYTRAYREGGFGLKGYSIW